MAQLEARAVRGTRPKDIMTVSRSGEKEILCAGGVVRACAREGKHTYVTGRSANQRCSTTGSTRRQIIPYSQINDNIYPTSHTNSSPIGIASTLRGLDVILQPQRGSVVDYALAPYAAPGRTVLHTSVYANLWLMNIAHLPLSHVLKRTTLDTRQLPLAARGGPCSGGSCTILLQIDQVIVLWKGPSRYAV